GSHADTAAYYRPLIRFLAAQPDAAARAWRVEVPFTAGHWEAYRLAPRFLLARGWERQTDIADDPLFYDGRLTAARYRTWLHALAVRYVAVADAPPDYAARAELRLIRAGLPYLRVVARLRHWTVYAVADPIPLASGAGRVVSVQPASLRLAITRRGSIEVRVRWSPYWQLGGVHGCVAPAGGFTRVSADAPGRAVLRMRFALGRVGSRAPRCD
ncbi:MAG: MFS transporter, partial [Acidobacteriota bacterium]|nr:MFS transporter [Acidobacteriota bacterium]